MSREFSCISPLSSESSVQDRFFPSHHPNSSFSWKDLGTLPPLTIKQNRSFAVNSYDCIESHKRDKYYRTNPIHSSLSPCQETSLTSLRYSSTRSAVTELAVAPTSVPQHPSDFPKSSPSSAFAPPHDLPQHHRSPLISIAPINTPPDKLLPFITPIVRSQNSSPPVDLLPLVLPQHVPRAATTRAHTHAHDGFIPSDHESPPPEDSAATSRALHARTVLYQSAVFPSARGSANTPHSMGPPVSVSMTHDTTQGTLVAPRGCENAAAVCVGCVGTVEAMRGASAAADVGDVTAEKEKAGTEKAEAVEAKGKANVEPKAAVGADAHSTVVTTADTTATAAGAPTSAPRTTTTLPILTVSDSITSAADTPEPAGRLPAPTVSAPVYTTATVLTAASTAPMAATGPTEDVVGVDTIGMVTMSSVEPVASPVPMTEPAMPMSARVLSYPSTNSTPPSEVPSLSSDVQSLNAEAPSLCSVESFGSGNAAANTTQSPIVTLLTTKTALHIEKLSISLRSDYLSPATDLDTWPTAAIDDYATYGAEVGYGEASYGDAAYERYMGEYAGYADDISSLSMGMGGSLAKGENQTLLDTARGTEKAGDAMDDGVDAKAHRKRCRAGTEERMCMGTCAGVGGLEAEQKMCDDWEGNVQMYGNIDHIYRHEGTGDSSYIAATYAKRFRANALLSPVSDTYMTTRDDINNNCRVSNVDNEVYALPFPTEPLHARTQDKHAPQGLPSAPSIDSRTHAHAHKLHASRAAHAALASASAATNSAAATTGVGAQPSGAGVDMTYVVSVGLANGGAMHGRQAMHVQSGNGGGGGGMQTHTQPQQSMLTRTQRQQQQQHPHLRVSPHALSHAHTHSTHSSQPSLSPAHSHTHSHSHTHTPTHAHGHGHAHAPGHGHVSAHPDLPRSFTARSEPVIAPSHTPYGTHTTYSMQDAHNARNVQNTLGAAMSQGNPTYNGRGPHPQPRSHAQGPPLPLPLPFAETHGSLSLSLSPSASPRESQGASRQAGQEYTNTHNGDRHPSHRNDNGRGTSVEAQEHRDGPQYPHHQQQHQQPGQSSRLQLAQLPQLPLPPLPPLPPSNPPQALSAPHASTTLALTARAATHSTTRRASAEQQLPALMDMLPLQPLQHTISAGGPLVSVGVSVGDGAHMAAQQGNTQRELPQYGTAPPLSLSLPSQAHAQTHAQTSGHDSSLPAHGLSTALTTQPFPTQALGAQAFAVQHVASQVSSAAQTNMPFAGAPLPGMGSAHTSMSSNTPSGGLMHTHLPHNDALQTGAGHANVQSLEAQLATLQGLLPSPTQGLLATVASAQNTALTAPGQTASLMSGITTAGGGSGHGISNGVSMSTGAGVDSGDGLDMRRTNTSNLPAPATASTTASLSTSAFPQPANSASNTTSVISVLARPQQSQSTAEGDEPIIITLPDQSRAYMCPTCGKHYQRKCNYLRHRLIHRGARPFQCSHCGKTFRERHHVVVHERIHTNEKPFQCRYCPKTFSDRSNCMRHQMIHREHQTDQGAPRRAPPLTVPATEALLPHGSANTDVNNTNNITNLANDNANGAIGGVAMGVAMGVGAGMGPTFPSVCPTTASTAASAYSLSHFPHTSTVQPPRLPSVHQPMPHSATHNSTASASGYVATATSAASTPAAPVATVPVASVASSSSASSSSSQPRTRVSFIMPSARTNSHHSHHSSHGRNADNTNTTPPRPPTPLAPASSSSAASASASQHQYQQYQQQQYRQHQQYQYQYPQGPPDNQYARSHDEQQYSRGGEYQQQRQHSHQQQQHHHPHHQHQHHDHQQQQHQQLQHQQQEHHYHQHYHQQQQQHQSQQEPLPLPLPPLPAMDGLDVAQHSRLHGCRDARRGDVQYAASTSHPQSPSHASSHSPHTHQHHQHYYHQQDAQGYDSQQEHYEHPQHGRSPHYDGPHPAQHRHLPPLGPQHAVYQSQQHTHLLHHPHRHSYHSHSHALAGASAYAQSHAGHDHSTYTQTHQDTSSHAALPLRLASAPWLPVSSSFCSSSSSSSAIAVSAGGSMVLRPREDDHVSSGGARERAQRAPERRHEALGEEPRGYPALPADLYGGDGGFDLGVGDSDGGAKGNGNGGGALLSRTLSHPALATMATTPLASADANTNISINSGHTGARTGGYAGVATFTATDAPARSNSSSSSGNGSGVAASGGDADVGIGGSRGEHALFNPGASPLSTSSTHTSTSTATAAAASAVVAIGAAAEEGGGAPAPAAGSWGMGAVAWEGSEGALRENVLPLPLSLTVEEEEKLVYEDYM